MMNFLWLVYRKYEYRNTIIRCTVYILLRTCVVLYLRDKFDWAYMDYKDYSILLHLLSCLIIGCIYIFDFIQFVYYSRKFYLHLKSREKEIKNFYYDNEAYLDSKFLRIHFKIANILVVTALFFFTLGYSINEFSIVLVYIGYFFPNINEWSIRFPFFYGYAFIFFPSILMYLH